MRVMLDTNIFISMIFFPSAQTRELAKRLADNHQIVVCDYVIEELRLVTNRKFPAKKQFLDRFFLELPFELVYTPKTSNLIEFPEMRDTKDSPILATAIPLSRYAPTRSTRRTPAAQRRHPGTA